MPRNSEDLGIAYLASSLEKAGRDVLIFDQGLTHFNDEAFSEWILRHQLHLIGFSDNSDRLDRIAGIARKIKARLPEVYQVIGDHVASHHADEILAGDTGIDAVCVGEGEHVLVELLQRLENGEPPEGIPGLLTRIGGRSRFSPRPKIATPSMLPWPKRYVLSHREPGDREPYSCMMIGSRGCPYQCGFCGNDLYQKLCPGIAWRPREAAEIVDEMELLYRSHHVDSFTFLDELFVGPPSSKNRDRLIRFCDEIGKRRLKLTFRITCRADFFEPPRDRELMVALREAGLDKIFFGIENGYPATIKLYSKGPDVSDGRMIENVNFVRDNGVFPFISFIMFHPFISAEEILFNLDFIHKLGNSHLWGTYTSRLRVTPDMSLFGVVKNSGLLKSGEKWGERPYVFADARMQNVWERLNRAGQYFRELDHDLETILFKLFHAGNEGKRLHESLRCRVGATYAYFIRAMMREDVATSELLRTSRDIRSLIDRAEAQLDNS